jgi:hypothetical protein
VSPLGVSDLAVRSLPRGTLCASDLAVRSLPRGRFGSSLDLVVDLCHVFGRPISNATWLLSDCSIWPSDHCHVSKIRQPRSTGWKAPRVQIRTAQICGQDDATCPCLTTEIYDRDNPRVDNRTGRLTYRTTKMVRIVSPRGTDPTAVLVERIGRLAKTTWHRSELSATFGQSPRWHRSRFWATVGQAPR